MGISSTLPALRVGGSSELALLPSESGKEAGVGGRSQPRGHGRLGGAGRV